MPKEVIKDETTPYHQLFLAWGRDNETVGLSTRMDEPSDEDGLVKAGPEAWVHLDRHGINRLIRTLRKARDQAFGADA